MRIPKAFVFGALCACVISCGRAEADSITVPNFSFEANTAANSNFNGTDYYGAPTDFTIAGGYGVEGTLANRFALIGNPGTSDGNRIGFMNVNSNSTAYMTTADPVTTITAGLNYTFTLAVGNTPGTGNFNDPGTINLNILAGPTAGNLSVVAFTSVDADLIPDGTITDYKATLTAAEIAALGLAGNDLSLQIEAINNEVNGENTQPTFDNLRLDSSVPEPSTWAMLLGGAGVLAFFQRRRVLKS